MSTSKRILITGSNRSGSTWVGKVIASNPTVDNIIEPLNLNRVKRFKRFKLDHWYPKVDASSPDELKNELRDILNFYLNTSYAKVFSEITSSYEGHKVIPSLKKRWRRAGKPVKMLKDPTALFSVPWLVDEFQLKPVLLVRHPAAYVLSIKEKNWWFDFDNMLNQADFFSGDLQSLEDKVKAFKKNETKHSIIENAALLWKVIYTQVTSYRNEYPDWYYVTHEDLSLHPLKEFKNLFDYLDLEFTQSVESYIIESTQSGKREESKHKRDAAANTRKWVDALSEKEKLRIREITEEVASNFYDNFEPNG